ncbi:MAG TPA: ATP-binding protein [Actinomycetes bacterium]|nr:ATP-binding protein [Actinomycetes bacterium]
MELIIPSSSRFLPRVRHAVGRALRGLPRDTVDDVLLVLDEAVSNAIRHGSRGGEPVEVTVRVDDDWIDIRVRDCGPTSRLPRVPAAAPHTLATGGRGLWLIKELVDEVRLRRAGEGTLLWARRRVRPAASLPRDTGVRSARPQPG